MEHNVGDLVACASTGSCWYGVIVQQESDTALPWKIHWISGWADWYSLNEIESYKETLARMVELVDTSDSKSDAP